MECTSVNGKASGSVLLFALIVALVFLVVAKYMADMMSLQFKSSYFSKKEFQFFSEVDSGIHAVAGWMAYYKRDDVPREVSDTDYYQVEVCYIADRVRRLPGFSGNWLGKDEYLKSMSEDEYLDKKGDNHLKIESIVFVAYSHEGYGNE